MSLKNVGKILLDLSFNGLAIVGSKVKFLFLTFFMPWNTEQ